MQFLCSPKIYYNFFHGSLKTLNTKTANRNYRLIRNKTEVPITTVTICTVGTKVLPQNVGQYEKLIKFFLFCWLSNSDENSNELTRKRVEI